MKKTYQNPQTIIIKIASQSILAGSSETMGYKGEFGGEGQLSREGGSEWFDDED